MKKQCKYFRKLRHRKEIILFREVAGNRNVQMKKLHLLQFQCSLKLYKMLWRKIEKEKVPVEGVGKTSLNFVLRKVFSREMAFGRKAKWYIGVSNVFFLGGRGCRERSCRSISERGNSKCKSSSQELSYLQQSKNTSMSEMEWGKRKLPLNERERTY